MTVSEVYLIGYNFVQALGSVWFLAISKSARGLFLNVSLELEIFQTLALLEVLHSIFKIVRSPVVTTLIQVSSRLIILWLVTWSVPSAQNGFGVALYILAWSISEIVRYSYYAFSLVNKLPYLLQWARYTFFIVLYPLGVSGELLTVYDALAEVKRTRVYSVELPNPANISFSFYYYLIFYMLSYIPLFPRMYLYMFGQRKKVLNPIAEPADQKTKKSD